MQKKPPRFELEMLRQQESTLQLQQMIQVRIRHGKTMVLWLEKWELPEENWESPRIQAAKWIFQHQ